MGWNPNCDKCEKRVCCCPAPKPCPPVSCDPATPCCPQNRQQAVPVITIEYVNDFDPNNVCKKYIYAFVVDAKNEIVYFYDIFGNCAIISDDGGVKRTLTALISAKQDRITEYVNETMYNPGDIVLHDNRMWVAQMNTTGVFNPADWLPLDGSAAVAPQYTFVPILPDVEDGDEKLQYVLPTGEVYFFQGGEYIKLKVDTELAWEEYTGLEAGSIIELSRIMVAQPTSPIPTEEGGRIDWRAFIDVMIDGKSMSLALSALLYDIGGGEFGLNGQFMVSAGDRSDIDTKIKLKAVAYTGDSYGFALTVEDSTVSNVKVRLNSYILNAGVRETGTINTSDATQLAYSRGVVDANVYDKIEDLMEAM